MIGLSTAEALLDKHYRHLYAPRVSENHYKTTGGRVSTHKVSGFSENLETLTYLTKEEALVRPKN